MCIKQLLWAALINTANVILGSKSKCNAMTRLSARCEGYFTGALTTTTMHMPCPLNLPLKQTPALVATYCVQSSSCSHSHALLLMFMQSFLCTLTHAPVILRSRTHAHALMLTHSCSRTHAHGLMLTHSCSWTDAPALMLVHSCSCTHARALCSCTYALALMLMECMQADSGPGNHLHAGGV